MSSAKDWTPAQVIALLREAATDGVAPPSSAWNHPSPERPTKRVVTTIFGSWRVAVEEAGLLTPIDAAKCRREQRDRDGEADRARRQRESAKPARKESVNAKWNRERREKKLEQMQQDLRSGRLRIYQATPQQMAEFAAARAARAARYAPTETDLTAVPGVTPKRRPEPAEDDAENADIAA